ncbi:MAG TPA: hypothetical protein VEC96_03965 [Anaerolineae bacterium]|nr:hypothetical protein [Anaerolineae bacterium]
MVFELFCMALIALLFGQALVFGGYRLFLFLLPIWGFFFGFGLGAQTLQVLFGVGLLATVSSWVVGFIVGVIFAVLSYLFYFIAVALLSGSFGYGLAVGLLTAIGMDFGFLVWLIGLVAGIAVAVVVLYFNIQKYAIITITAIAGTSVIIFTLLALFSNITPGEMLLGPVRVAIQSSFLWLLFFIVLAGAGIAVQLMANRRYEIEDYNRLADEGLA